MRRFLRPQKAPFANQITFLPPLKISSFIHGLPLKHLGRLLDRSPQLFTSFLTRPNNPIKWRSNRPLRWTHYAFHHPKGAAIAH